MCPTTTASPPTTTLLKNMKRKRPTLKETQANQKIQWSDVPLDVQQAIMYLEYRKLRHKHPHV
jgi:hypothetical protein